MAWTNTGGIALHIGELDADLYGGSAGIGLFFAELARLTGLGRFRRAALTCRKTWHDSSFAFRGRMGAFDGLAGLVFAELAVARALRLPLSDLTAADLSRLAELVDSDKVFDVISGSAGVLLVALRARLWPELAPQALRLAEACANHLHANAIAFGDAAAWSSQSFKEPLTGLAHGACGIGMALAEQAAISGRSADWSMAKRALRFASRSYDKKQRMWRDLRNESGHMVAWCHGTAGIVLARQRFAALAPARADRRMLREIRDGLLALRQGPDMSSDTVCHGRSGNWEPMWRGSPPDRSEAERQLLSLCDRLRRGGQPGGDFCEPTPDLMNGSAGLGLQILRSFDRSVTDVSTLNIGGES